MFFAAIEVRPGEADHTTITVFFKHAAGMGLSFKFLEPYGRFTLGSTPFLRFRTDCPDMITLLPFFQEDGRSLILPKEKGYAVFTQTTEGKVPIVTMQNPKAPGYQRRYRGTSDKFWQRQFS